MPVIPPTWEAEIGLEGCSLRPAREGCLQDSISTHSWAQWCTPVIPNYMGG
jgi:hypothetical protein